MLKIYVCGPTVYNSVHIGNIRPIVTIDLMLKAAKILGIEYKFIHNITDIDDKIIDKAIATNINEQEISKKYATEYLEILKTLNVDTITNVEYVTDNISLITSYIEKLLANKKAYLDKNNNVWFDVLSCQEEYGKISNRQLQDMVFDESENSNLKKNPADFALWKKTTKGIKFDSPWGPGRPGWHTECVVLINKHFDKQGVDIHGGGVDLIFPHHENENIQHFSLFKKPLAKQWLRTGQINLNSVKMSKSLGNVILAKDFLADQKNVDLYKLIILSSKFSAPLNLTDELFSNVEQVYKKYKKTYFKSLLTLRDKKVTFEQNEALKDIAKDLFDLDFSTFNLKVNALIKDLNKETNLEKAYIFKNITELIHFNFTNEKYINEFIKIFDEWNYFIGKKEYQQADKLRQILIENNLI
ncbi:class I tRNA ligase family protein [Mycoplasmopsis hyopharyngis]|uniref:class I tRNA ligase family protein n=1 Tax=Mycoplasmopsis hyopharyngis TaxID=29558 RepID=UPI003872CA50